MHLQLMRQQPRKPEPCDNCAGQDIPDQTPKAVKQYNIFPYGAFVLCAPCADELRKPTEPQIVVVKA